MDETNTGVRAEPTTLQVLKQTGERSSVGATLNNIGPIYNSQEGVKHATRCLPNAMNFLFPNGCGQN